MELPAALRQAVDRALEGVSLPDLGRAAAEISRLYRGDAAGGRFHIADDLAARAYLATRLPATYAAIRAACAMVKAVRPDFAPASLLDVGAGPGTALWAARDCWAGIDSVLLIEGAAPMRAWGEPLARLSGATDIAWQAANIVADAPAPAARDLVTLAYVLNEIAPADRPGLVERLWAATADTLLIVEPGTPAGRARILDARGPLLAAGAQLPAPCPHAGACPIAAPDWCHFSRRVARSRLHRQAKGGEVPWEDEKFTVLAVSRQAGTLPRARVIAPPQAASGQVALKLCTAEGQAVERRWSRRDGAAFKAARRLDWGDAVDG